MTPATDTPAYLQSVHAALGAGLVGTVSTPAIDAARAALAAAERAVEVLRDRLRAELEAQAASGYGAERAERRLLGDVTG